MKKLTEVIAAINVDRTRAGLYMGDPGYIYITEISAPLSSVPMKCCEFPAASSTYECLLQMLHGQGLARKICIEVSFIYKARAMGRSYVAGRSLDALSQRPRRP